MLSQWKFKKCIIDFLDKPTPPCGPLKIADVNAEGCNLSWNPPTDDGGLPIDHYLVEKMDPKTGVWTPAGETFGPDTSMKVNFYALMHNFVRINLQITRYEISFLSSKIVSLTNFSKHSCSSFVTEEWRTYH